MRRLFIAFCVVSLSLIACQKQSPEIDYSGPVTLFRMGDESYSMPFDQPYFVHDTGRNPKYRLGGFFDENGSPELFIFNVSWPDSGQLKKGEAITPEKVEFINPDGVGKLGYTMAIERGVLRYMGETGGKFLFRFEDLTFKCTRRDGSGITDYYYIRGTAEIEQYSPS